MQASQIILDVRRELIETTGLFWSDTEILRSINRAELDFINKTRILEDSAQMPLTQGRLDYPLPSNFISAKALFLKITNNDGTFSWARLYPTNVEKNAQESPNFLSTGTDNQGQPTKYWIWNRTMWLNKAPDAANATELHMFFKSKPISLTSSSQSINLDDTLSEAINAYVLWKAWTKEKEQDLAAEQKVIYDRYVAEGRKWVKRQSGDQRYRLDIDSQSQIEGRGQFFGPLS